MLRLVTYVKKYWLSILCIVALLYGQAQCELALPDYMSDIISVGIQAGGVESAVPMELSKETYEKVKILMSEENVAFLDQCYRYEDRDNDSLYYAVEESMLQKGVYVLKEESYRNDSRLQEAFAAPLLITYGIEATQQESTTTAKDEINEMLSQLPEGVDPFVIFARMSEEQKQEICDSIEDKLSVMGESSALIASAQMVSKEYESLGIATDQIQMIYIGSVGVKMLSIAFAGVLCAILVGYFSSRSAAGIARDLRRDVFEKVESFSNEELTRFSTASLITRTTNDVQQIQMALTMMLRFMIYSPIMGIGAIIRVLDSDGSMIWIIAATVILIMIVISILMAVAGPKFKAMQKLVDRLNLVMREQLNGMLVIRAFHNEDKEAIRFDHANKNMTNTQLFTTRSMALMMPIIMFIFNSVSLVIIWVGSHLVDLGTMQIGDMMAYMQYAMQIIMSFMFIAMIALFIPRAGVAAKRVFEVLDTKLSIQDPEVEEEPLAKGTVAFHHVSFAYPGAEEEVLSDINFCTKPGQTTAFIGSTGSGKSTIVNLIQRFYDVSKGSIEIDGVDVRKMNQQTLRRKIGFVPQKGQLFSGTIASNIKFSDASISDEQMREAAEIAQASEFIESKPEGYQTPIAQGGGNVSGGQKQRISIARAIAKQPEIFIFDDSFSALDFKTDAKLREALGKLCRKNGATMLVIAQRIASIMHADQIIVLEEGRMVGKGTHEELMKDCPIYQEIALSQLSKEELENE